MAIKNAIKLDAAELFSMIDRGEVSERDAAFPQVHIGQVDKAVTAR